MNQLSSKHPSLAWRFEVYYDECVQNGCTIEEIEFCWNAFDTIIEEELDFFDE